MNRFLVTLLIMFLVLLLVNAIVDPYLYENPGETKYEWEILQKGTIRYLDRLKLVRKYETRVKSQGLPVERYIWPILSEEDKTYECSVPFLLPKLEVTDTTEDIELEVSPFLRPLRETCIYRWEGWWTYEFCYGKHVRQFHQEQDGTVPAIFFLGQDLERTSGVPNLDYYSEEYEEGSICDLTGKPRTCEIRFYCDPTSDVSAFSSIKEPSSCNYIIRIDTPLLCKHPKYSSKLDEETEKILCFEGPIPTEEMIQEEEQKLKKTKQTQSIQKLQQTNQQQSTTQNQQSQNTLKQTQQTNQQQSQNTLKETQQTNQQQSQNTLKQSQTQQSQNTLKQSQQQQPQNTQKETKQTQQNSQSKQPTTQTSKKITTTNQEAEEKNNVQFQQEESHHDKPTINIQIQRLKSVIKSQDQIDPTTPIDPSTEETVIEVEEFEDTQLDIEVMKLIKKYLKLDKIEPNDELSLLLEKFGIFDENLWKEEKSEEEDINEQTDDK